MSSRTGRNRTYLNGNLAPVHLLEELGGALVDVHGQHEQQSLLSPSVQVDALDAYGRLHPFVRNTRPPIQGMEADRWRTGGRHGLGARTASRARPAAISIQGDLKPDAGGG